MRLSMSSSQLSLKEQKQVNNRNCLTQQGKRNLFILKIFIPVNTMFILRFNLLSLFT